MDSRDRAAYGRSDGLTPDPARMVLVNDWFDEGGDEGGDELPAEIPGRFEVCGICDGKGSHVNPSIDAHGLGPDDFAEDPDFADAYFSGAYDQTCNECRGKRVVMVHNLPDDSPALKALHARWDDADAHFAEVEAERRAGC